MLMPDTDVVVVGAGPTGLMLAAELRLGGVRTLVLERQPRISEIPKAGGLGGRILEVLRYRGLLDRFAEASANPHPRPIFPFGGVHLDFTELADPPLRALSLKQAQLERLLDERAHELGAEVRRGHEAVAVSQDQDQGQDHDQSHAVVGVDVRDPDGVTYTIRARYIVGCDGGRSRIRDQAGIGFPGTTYPEVNRLGQVAVPDSVTRLANGDLEVPGLGRLGWGFTRTERGLFSFASTGDGELLVFTTEEAVPDADDDTPMTLDELQDSVRRVLGGDLPMERPRRLSRFVFQARHADRYREGRILLAGDAAHLLPATGAALNLGMTDAVNLGWKLAAEVHGWAPEGLLDTYQEERHAVGARALLQTQAQVALRRGQDAAADALRSVFQELCSDESALRRMGNLIGGTDVRYPPPHTNADADADADQHALTGTFAPDLVLHAASTGSTEQGLTSVAEVMHRARPVLLDLADRPELRKIAEEWRPRIEVCSAKTDQRPADVLLIRPDAYIAWAAGIDQPADVAASGLRKALSRWFGEPTRRA